MTTFVDTDDPSGSRFRRHAWVIFTDLGVRYSEELGIEGLRDINEESGLNGTS